MMQLVFSLSLRGREVYGLRHRTHDVFEPKCPFTYICNRTRCVSFAQKIPPEAPLALAEEHIKLLNLALLFILVLFAMHSPLIGFPSSNSKHPQVSVGGQR
jgi:hypothetical protein